MTGLAPSGTRLAPTGTRLAPTGTRLAPVLEPMRSLGEVFERGHALSPDRVAVRDGVREVSYRELDALIALLARALVDLGVRRGHRVAVWLPKSIEAIAAMQAALRIGAVYVPVDPQSPVERVGRLLGDCHPAACVALAGDLERMGDGGLSGMALLALSRPGGAWRLRYRGGSSSPLLRPASAGEPAARESSAGEPPAHEPPAHEPPAHESPARPDPPVGREELAYILYTSGSTGVPKGVCISHGNALAFVEWAYAELAPHGEDRFANHAPLHFDLSVLDVYVAFLAGACVCLVSEALAFVPARLADFVRSERITVWYSVPSALMLMERAGLLEDPPPALRAVLFAGEPFPIEPLRRLRRALPSARLLNLYGPTETNVCTFHEVDEIPADAVRPVPIGRACSGDSVWIEDEDGRRLPVGGRGELVVAGPTVMAGYWNGPPHHGPYRTGDMVERISRDGYRYIGRRDAMVKVRGYRVELGEVEAAICGHEDVIEAAVVVLGGGLESRLVAVVVPRAGATPDLLAIKRFCADRVPRHMLVHGLRVVSELPRNRNGKLDRRALAASLRIGEAA